jgi:two-component system chemotaxis sensor kinase CheA
MSRRDAELKERLLATFRVEADEHLHALSANLLALGETPGDEQAGELVEVTFREMHTLKGAARSVGLRDVEQVCQACESLLSAIRRDGSVPGRAVLGRLEAAVDAVARLVAGDAPATPVAELVGRLELTTADPAAAAAVAEPAMPAPARAVPAPAPARPAPAATIRLASADLDALLRRAEELLSIKLAADDWVTRSDTLVTNLRRLRANLERQGGDGEPVRAAEADARSLLGRLLRDRRTIASAVDGLLDETRRVRMMPAAAVLDVFPRMVRDVAEAQGKEAEWVAIGGELEVDRRVLETIKDPLIHLVRNAIDHGLEPPDVRVAAGKPRRGRVAATVSSLEGGRIQVVVSDDGRGIDPARVKDAARRARLAVGDTLSDDAALELVFRSGLSTSFVITDVSGHGLGLAIVKEQVERISGRVELDSRVGSGTTVRLTVPATIATFRGVLVRAGGQPFLIALEAVERVIWLTADEPETVQGREVIRRDGDVLPCAPLDALLGIEQETGEPGRRACAIVGAGADRVAIRVDEVLGEREVLVKDFAPPLLRVRNVVGAGLLGAGELVLILRPADLVKGVRELPAAAAHGHAAAAPARQPWVLVVDDALTTRTMERGLLEMAGYRVSVAVDGLDAWTALKSDTYDLVVSDVDMPRLDGFALTERIRADPSLADLPVVLVSALEAREDKERGIEVGANAYVVKSSFEQSNLLEIIRRLGVKPDRGRPT